MGTRREQLGQHGEERVQRDSVAEPSADAEKSTNSPGPGGASAPSAADFMRVKVRGYPRSVVSPSAADSDTREQVC